VEKDNIITISEKQMLTICGGGITASLISAFNGLIKQIYGMGQNFGSTINRLINRKTC
jgi:hypothetical protein